MLRALERVRAAGVPAQLWLAGIGTIEAEIRAQISEADSEGHVRLLGFVPNVLLLELLRSHAVDVVALPSSGEGIPVSLMEALAAGVPVVACNAGGVAELVGDGAGVLVDIDDEDAFVDGLETMLTDDAARRAAATRGRRRVEEEFAADVTTVQFADLHKRPRRPAT